MSGCITLSQTTERVKKIIANVKNTDPSNVLQFQTLRGDLGFTNAGVGALSPHINDDFSDFFDIGTGVTPAEARSAITVADLTELIWGEVPLIKRC